VEPIRGSDPDRLVDAHPEVASRTADQSLHMSAVPAPVDRTDSPGSWIVSRRRHPLRGGEHGHDRGHDSVAMSTRRSRIAVVL
jgi:hypothetical protein